jgi:hypothetical protein
MSDFIGFGIGDKEVLNNGRIERYKGKENHTDRIGMVWLYQDENGEYKMFQGDPDNDIQPDTPKFTKAHYHYIPGVGYVMPKGEYTIKKFGAPKLRLGTYIVKYRTDRTGKVLKPFEYEIMEWQFGTTKFQLLSAINDEFPLVYHDIKVTCTGEQYQKLSFTACSGEALWRQNEALRKEILERVQQQGDLSLVRDMSLAEIKAAVGEEAQVIGAEEDEDQDFDDLLADLG